VKTRFLNHLWPAVLAAPFLSGCMHRPVDRPVHGWDHMMGPWGSALMLLVLIVLVGLVVYLLLERRRSDNRGTESTPETPMEILKKRYAKGEITKEEFDRMKDEIES